MQGRLEWSSQGLELSPVVLKRTIGRGFNETDWRKMDE